MVYFEREKKNTLYATCGKVAMGGKLIAGRPSLICDECVELCMDIIREETKSSGLKAPMACRRQDICDFWTIRDRAGMASGVLSVPSSNHYSV